MSRPLWTEAPPGSVEREIGEVDDSVRRAIRALRFVAARLEEELASDDLDATTLPPLLRKMAEARLGLACTRRNELRNLLEREREKREQAAELLPQ